MDTADRGFEELLDGAAAAGVVDAGAEDLAPGVVAGWAVCAKAAAGANDISATPANAATALLILFIAHLVALQESKDQQSVSVFMAPPRAATITSLRTK